MSGVANGGNGSQPEVTVDHLATLSNDELVNLINGSSASLARGIPVLIVPASDGRLAAVAVNGLQILVPTNSRKDAASRENQDDHGSGGKDFRALLFLLTSLAASITYTVGFAPPGGVWSSDDKATGQIAGTPVLRDKFPRRYICYYYLNTTAFYFSLLLMILLSYPNRSKKYTFLFRSAALICLISLGGSYTSGTSIQLEHAIYSFVLLSGCLAYLVIRTLLSIHGGQIDPWNVRS